MVREAAAADEKKWDEFVAGQPGARLYHLYRWRGVLEKSFGSKTFYLIAEKNGSVSGVLPLAFQKSPLFGSHLISLTFFNYAGALAADPAAQEELIAAAVKLAGELKAGYLELRHAEKNVAGLPAREHKVTFILDLPPSAEALWKELKDKVRNQARKGEKEGLEFREFSSGAGLDKFYPVFALNMRNLGSPVISKEFFRNILEAFPEKARIFAAFSKGRPVAAGFTLTHGSTMEIPWAASDWKYLKWSPNVFLYWNILRRACELKLKQFDFGRCSRGGGTHHFKEQWGGREIPLYWFYHVPGGSPADLRALRPPLIHRIFSSFWKWMPLPLANALGPRLSSRLPV